ncbi:MAG: CsgG/HfaB family protein [Parvularculaceae bacterium]
MNRIVAQTAIAAATVAFSLSFGGSAFAQKRVDYNRGSTDSLAIPTCTTPIGTLAIENGTEYRGWVYYGLGQPEKLLKVFVQRSGCFKLVNRGRGLDATRREQALSQGGDLQRRSNVGGGQIKAADYVMIADIVGTDSNAGGSGALGGLAGRAIGGRFGAVVGGIKTKRVEAQTVLEVTNVRTTEGVAFAEGTASKKDISFGGGGWAGFGGAVGGGYEDTEVGKVVTYAFLDAYRNIVGQLGGELADVSAADAAPKETFAARKNGIKMHRSPSESGSVLRDLDKGMIVYPTGAKEDLWWEVEDENGNVGWILNTDLKPAK